MHAGLFCRKAVRTVECRAGTIVGIANNNIGAGYPFAFFIDYFSRNQCLSGQAHTDYHQYQGKNALHIRGVLRDST